ncbi:UDP-2-acetamido-2,6-beta-L-arabino-hexul-4-ose reductase [Buttiauxella ferragutiae]|uniref:UDP-2-acetamido-2,6-beta-L-arabino-hexul-4-ose reductase n=1 Tax=Buttiauxella ferragutiae TaxID=82989 RepID=UPI001F531F37|nr:NAD-dependent epimerase/dehydratase family protein [Buttiauxella ferragutiae]UNK62856.1 NAD-dependent epimerase/dehydratase family protein [Buttiauxella ferragutiae]
MKILVTGADGFIGRNLCIRLEDTGYENIIRVDRNTPKSTLYSGLNSADFVFHLAGVNRPINESEFVEGNADLTKSIVDYLKEHNPKASFILSSSTQALADNGYGKSKALAETIVEKYGRESEADYYIYRLPNVFGKWCKPNYNSFVATFCYNITNDIEITINDPKTPVTLIYIDDLCDELIKLLKKNRGSGYQRVSPEYHTTVGEVAGILKGFKISRSSLVIDDVGVGFKRALYSTWLSYQSPEQFSYNIPAYADERGVFCEMLKTKTSGQFSFFTAHKGVTRGGHYHHTKNEKFLVIKGKALFRFEHIITHERYELIVNSDSYQVVETVPGWTHDITNIGDIELVVMLWANEIFDREAPDTITRVL